MSFKPFKKQTQLQPVVKTDHTDSEDLADKLREMRSIESSRNKIVQLSDEEVCLSRTITWTLEEENQAALSHYFRCVMEQLEDTFKDWFCIGYSDETVVETVFDGDLDRWYELMERTGESAYSFCFQDYRIASDKVEWIKDLGLYAPELVRMSDDGESFILRVVYPLARVPDYAREYVIEKRS